MIAPQYALISPTLQSHFFLRWQHWITPDFSHANFLCTAQASICRWVGIYASSSSTRVVILTTSRKYRRIYPTNSCAKFSASYEKSTRLRACYKPEGKLLTVLCSKTSAPFTLYEILNFITIAFCTRLEQCCPPFTQIHVRIRVATRKKDLVNPKTRTHSIGYLPHRWSVVPVLVGCL